MATRAEICSNNLKRVLSLLGVTKVEDGIKKVQTQCQGRLGLGRRDYEFCCGVMNVPINREIITEDRMLFRKESVVRQFCSRLKVSAAVLKDKMERFIPIEGMTRRQLVMVREILGIKYDQSKYQLSIRSPQMKKEEQKIIESWNAGKTYNQIGLELGIPMGNVMGRVVQLRRRGINIPIRPPGGFTRQEGFNIDDIAGLIRAGWGAKEIALKFGKKPHSMAGLISLWRSKFGVEKMPYIQKVRKV